MPKNVIIIAGPNGSGKTTFASEYLRDADMEYISADAIAATLVSKPEDMDKVKLQAGRLFFVEMRRLIESEQDFAVEVTLAGKGFERLISQLKRAGYTVTIVFIFLKSPEMSVARVRNRVEAGGHHVPTEDVVRRFYRSKQNFWDIYQTLADQWSLFDNSGQSPQKVAFGERNQFTVTEPEAFEIFMRDIRNGGITMRQVELSLETYKQAHEFQRIGNRAAKRAQEENRKKGIPNVYSFNGHIYYELPNGELTKENPYEENQ